MEKVSLREAIDIFGDDLWEILPEKQSALKTEIIKKTKELEAEDLSFKTRFKKSMLENKIPLEDRSLYLMVCEIFWKGSEMGRELDRLKKELGKIEFTLEVLRGNRHVIDVESARNFLLVNVFPGELKGTGNIKKGTCPFHDEEHPSFAWYVDTNSFYCYSCKRGGDVISFVQELKNLSFKEAAEYLS